MPEFLKVTKEESNQKLMNFLQRRFDLSNAEIQKLVRKNEVRINNKKSDAFDRVQENDEIRIPPFVLYREKVEKQQEKRVKNCLHTFEENSIEKNYEDSELLVISKPFGFAIQGGSKQEISLTSIIQEEYKNLSFTPTIAHRLDKDTSGLVLIAKTYNCLQELHTAFADKKNTHLEKFYTARLENFQGTNLQIGTWEDYLYIEKDNNGKERTAIAKNEMNKNAKIALSEVKILQENHQYLDLEILLITGRKHQIRVQCASRKHPILGDVKYGGQKAQRLHLHATKIIWKGQEFYSKPSWL